MLCDNRCRRSFDDGWRVPTMLAGSPRRTAARALETGPMGLQAKSIEKVRWPSTDPKHSVPVRYWIAVAGSTAADVGRVVVTSDVDTFRAVPGSDGSVRTLILDGSTHHTVPTHPQAEVNEVLLS